MTGVALPLFIATTVAIEALAVVFLIRGFRATSRSACTRCVGHCAALAFGEIMVAMVAKMVAVSSSFTDVAEAHPSDKAALLSQSIDAASTIGSAAIPTAVVPVAFAVLLYLRARRLPATR